MKKYLFLIPTLFIMLLNCITFGQAAASDYPIDYSEYHKDLQDVDYLLQIFDIGSSDVDVPYNPYYDNYIYYVRSNKTVTDKFLSGESNSITFTLYFYDISVEDYSSDDISVSTNYKANGKFCSVTYSRSKDGVITSNKGVGNGGNNPAVLRYNKLSGFLEMSASSSSLSQYTYYDSDQYVWHFESNVPDFSIEYDNDSLNVEVEFMPGLSGYLDRKLKVGNSVQTYDTFTFSISNNSTFAIQYCFVIVEENDSFAVGSTSFSSSGYTGDPTFAFVSDEWCIVGNVSGGVTGSKKVYKPCAWHYLSACTEKTFTISFSQMLLKENAGYNVYVYAMRNDYLGEAVVLVPSHSVPDTMTSSIDFSTAEQVYWSNFICVNPAKFDPDLKSSDCYAFDPEDEEIYRRASAYVDENGDTVIDRFDTTSLLAGSVPKEDDAWYKYSSSQNSVNDDISLLSSNFSNYFKFVNVVFGYFPKNYQSIISVGLVSLVALGIVKAVIR